MYLLIACRNKTQTKKTRSTCSTIEHNRDPDFYTMHCYICILFKHKMRKAMDVCHTSQNKQSTEQERSRTKTLSWIGNKKITQTDLTSGIGRAVVTLLRQDQGHNQTVKTEGFSENKNEDHAHEESLLLAHSADTRITHDTNCHTGGKSTVKCQTNIEKMSGKEAWASYLIRYYIWCFF